MRLDNLAGLMAPRVSQTRRTRPREVVTSALMASLSINSSCTKREIALVNSFIPPLHFLLLLGSSERILTFSLCNCVFSLALSGEFSLFPSVILLLPLDSHRRILCISLCIYSCASALSGSPGLFPPAPLPSAFAPPQTSLCILSTMPRERGKSRRGSLYYSALSRHATDLPPPNWLSLQFAPPAPGIIARGRQSLHRHPLTPSMETAWLKRKHHLRESALLCSLILLPPPKINPQDPVFGTGKLHGGGGNSPKLAGGGAHDEHWRGQGSGVASALCKSTLGGAPPTHFQIRQKQDDQLHSQRILGQRLDILFDALVDAPARTRCPTCGQKYIPVYNIHGRPSSPEE
jgi:hypothetical protein